MTQISSAQQGLITEQMKKVAKDEPLRLDQIQRRIAAGYIVIPWNPNHHPTPVGIGKGLRVKVNANIGTSREYCNIEEEKQKAQIALESKTHAIMDLSTHSHTEQSQMY